MTETEKFEQFNAMYGLNKKEMTHEQALTTANLMLDEVVEFLGEFYDDFYIHGFSGGAFQIDAFDKIKRPNLNAAAKELEDIRYITGQQMTEVGMNVTAIGDEVHRSNMSKAIDIFEPEVAANELETAKQRYPDAELIPHESNFVIKCKNTGKVIKPTTYTPAEITDEMVGL